MVSAAQDKAARQSCFVNIITVLESLSSLPHSLMFLKREDPYL